MMGIELGLFNQMAHSCAAGSFVCLCVCVCAGGPNTVPTCVAWAFGAYSRLCETTSLSFPASFWTPRIHEPQAPHPELHIMFQKGLATNTHVHTNVQAGTADMST